MLTLSHSTCATARLFILKSLFDENQTDKHIIITDNTTDIDLLRQFAKIIVSQPVHIVESLSDFWMMQESGRGLFCIPSSLLETHGNMDYLKRHSLFELKRGSQQSIEATIEKLIEFGYIHAHHAWELATYRRAWSIVTITDASSGNTIYIEWFDTEIDSIVEIDSSTSARQFRDIVSIKNQHLETTPIDRKVGTMNLELVEHIRAHTTWKIILIGCDFLSYVETLRTYVDIHCTDFHREDSISMGVDIESIHHIDAFLAFLREKTVSQGVSIYTKFAKTIEEFVEFHNLERIQVIAVQRAWIESFTMDTITLNEKKIGNIVIADDIIGQVFVRTRNKKSITKHLDLLLSLKPGDLVVHREHGIALFYAVIHKNTGNIEREYLELHYAQWDKLFVPLTEIYRVSKYLGKPDVELTKLSGKEWERTMEKTNEEIEAIALDILETSARRSLAKWRSFAKFRDKETEFQNAFAHEYTRDQSSAIEEVYIDMESEVAMDRLISGDVGFGKTEIAMNAIYKAVLSGTQVAVISPLLVLADEHYDTFIDRLAPFGVRVGIMTRMSSTREIESTLEALKTGNIDVVVGTHRLLSEDVKYKKLWLLVIDEEHKFGVTHKERLKKIRAGVDILSLSATPIPRSLNLALSWLKKISIVGTPPKKKKPIETIISRWDEWVIAHAIHHELSRSGQVIILHNRIRGMDSLFKEIETILDTSTHMLPINAQQPSIVITHGQMPGDQIEDRIHAFKKWEYNILLSTTIIENGVNFLAANTIIIIDPEEFGLASLHQLRGRVGRKDVDAYCYLMYRKPELWKDEKERLITIANNTHLGAGFEIAMRDMEIRGAWDVLGIKQSGKSKDIGLTLYFRLLEERIAELRDEQKKRVLTRIELDISYILPEALFLSEADKLNFFREIESLETLEELEEMEKEMTPILECDTGHGGWNLFLLIRSRLILSQYAVSKLSKMGMNYVFDLSPSAQVSDTKRFLDRFDSKNRMILLSAKKIRIEVRHWKSIEDFLTEFISW